MSAEEFSVLIGIDFSESSSCALSQAVQLIGTRRARLHLGHVSHSGAFILDKTLGPDIPEEFPDAIAARASLRRIRDELAAKADIELHVRLSMSPIEGLMGLIMELKPDLVVVGSHGKGVVRRTLLGSVSKELALHCPVPVLIVPLPERAKLLSQMPPAPQV